MPTIIRAANRKTVREIHHEIRAAQVQDMEATCCDKHVMEKLPSETAM